MKPDKNDDQCGRPLQPPVALARSQYLQKPAADGTHQRTGHKITENPTAAVNQQIDRKQGRIPSYFGGNP